MEWWFGFLWLEDDDGDDALRAKIRRLAGVGRHIIPGCSRLSKAGGMVDCNARHEERLDIKILL